MQRQQRQQQSIGNNYTPFASPPTATTVMEKNEKKKKMISRQCGKREKLKRRVKNIEINEKCTQVCAHCTFDIVSSSDCRPLELKLCAFRLARCKHSLAHTLISHAISMETRCVRGKKWPLHKPRRYCDAVQQDFSVASHFLSRRLSPSNTSEPSAAAKPKDEKKKRTQQI